MFPQHIVTPSSHEIRVIISRFSKVTNSLGNQGIVTVYVDSYQVEKEMYRSFCGVARIPANVVTSGI